MVCSLTRAQAKVQGSKPLWDSWYTIHASRGWAAARALTVLNRWAKRDDCPKKADIYKLKDLWIGRHFDKITRAEYVREDSYGKTVSRELYCLWFDVNGREVCFHSHRKPSRVDGQRVRKEELPQGRDLPSYGSPLEETEQRELPLTLPQLYRALEFYLISECGC